MRGALHCKRQTIRRDFDAVLAATASRPVVEVSAPTTWDGARSHTDRCQGNSVLGRLWMELRHHVRDGNPNALSSAWIDRIPVGCLAGVAVAGTAGPSA